MKKTLLGVFLVSSIFTSSLLAGTTEVVRSWNFNGASVKAFNSDGIKTSDRKAMYGTGLELTRYESFGLMYGGKIDYNYSHYEDMKIHSFSSTLKAGLKYDEIAGYGLIVGDFHSAAKADGSGIGFGVGGEWWMQHDYAVSFEFSKNKITGNEKIGDYNFNKFNVSFKFLF